MSSAPFDLLVCPVCRRDLMQDQRTLVCADDHRFDLAKQGYVGLLTGRRPPTAGTAQMVRARVEFLAADHYAPLAASLAGMAAMTRARTVLDAGVGTGYYLASVLDALPDAVGLGLDTSAPALRAAARTHARAGAAAWDVWRAFPVRTDSVDLLLNVFAPRNGPEFRRVLRTGGTLLTVTPEPAHLAELRAPLGLLGIEDNKDERLLHTLGEGFIAHEDRVITADLALDATDLTRLAAMTPAAHHIDETTLAGRILLMRPPVPATAVFRVRRFSRIADAADS